MAEKIFNTRILHKIDTLENWNASTLPLKKGEIALATAAASVGSGLTEPVVMIKIGEDGVKTFKDLPWNFYAKASDVLAAAKSESALTKFVEGVITSKKLATNEALTALTNRVTTAESDIDALEGLVGSETVATQIQNAINDLNLSNTYAAKEHTHEIADVTGLSNAIADAKKAGTDATSALNAYKTANDKAVQANTNAISAINNADTGILAQAKSYADGKDAAIAAAKKAGDDAQADVDALEAKVGTVTDGKTVVQMIADEAATARAAEKANADAINAHKEAVDAKVTTLIGSDTNKSVRTIANEELAAQLIPENASESLNTLQEIAAWIQAHPNDASTMNAAIKALQDKVGNSSVSDQITAAINDLKNKDIQSAVNRIAALEGKSHEHANKALLDTYTQTEANLADAVAKKHEHANKAELDKFATGDKAKLDSAVQTVTAGTGLKATKSGTDVAIDFDETITFVFDCGNSTN